MSPGGPDAGHPAPTLRERKRERTRRALVDAAARLVEAQGYERTTVAQIAAAAEVGTRTFFGYFPTKEDVFFPDSALRVEATLTAVAARRPQDSPVDVLLRGLDDVVADDLDLVSPLAALRLRLIRDVPAVRGRALQVSVDAQRRIAAALQEAFAPELDAVSAAALVGAFTGAVSGALLALVDEAGRPDGAPPDRLRARLRQATVSALRPPSTGTPPGDVPAGPSTLEDA